MLILSILAFLYFTYLFAKSFLIAYATNYIIDEDNFQTPDAKSILLLGSDAEQTSSAGARTDVMIVVTINPENMLGNTEINAVSIPRDMLIQNTCSGEYSKANAIYSYGYLENQETAVNCTVESVENFLNIPIDYYVETSFSGLINMVDGIGGIEIDVDYPFEEQDSEGNPGAISFEAGLQTLNGEEALAYARQRKYSSDYERNLRQQQVISAILAKVLSDPTEYLDTFLNVYMQNVYTNFTASDLMNYANLAIGFFNNTMSNLSSNTPLVLDIKTSPTSNNTSIGEGSDLILGLDLSNIVTRNLIDLYGTPEELVDNELYPQLAEYTDVQQLFLTKRATNFPSARITYDENGKKIENEVNNTITIQNYSLKVEDINGAYGFYSYASPFSLNYTSNMLRLALNLEPEFNTFDYTIVSSFGGPSLSTILYADEYAYDVDYTSLYEAYGVSQISNDQYLSEVQDQLDAQEQYEEEPTDITCSDDKYAVDSDFDGFLDSCFDKEVEEIIDESTDITCSENQYAVDSDFDGVLDTCNDNEEVTEPIEPEVPEVTDPDVVEPDNPDVVDPGGETDVTDDLCPDGELTTGADTEDGTLCI